MRRRIFRVSFLIRVSVVLIDLISDWKHDLVFLLGFLTSGHRMDLFQSPQSHHKNLRPQSCVGIPFTSLATFFLNIPKHDFNHLTRWKETDLISRMRKLSYNG
jgi:hypothetical protein